MAQDGAQAGQPCGQQARNLHGNHVTPGVVVSHHDHLVDFLGKFQNAANNQRGRQKISLP